MSAVDHTHDEGKEGTPSTTHGSSIEGILGTLQLLSQKLESIATQVAEGEQRSLSMLHKVNSISDMLLLHYEGISNKFNDLEKRITLMTSNLKDWEASRVQDPYQTPKKLTTAAQTLDPGSSGKRALNVTTQPSSLGIHSEDYNNQVVDLSDDEGEQGSACPVQMSLKCENTAQQQQNFKPVGNCFMQLEKMKTHSHQMTPKKPGVSIDRSLKRPKLEPNVEPNLERMGGSGSTTTMGPDVTEVAKGKLTPFTTKRSHQKTKGSNTQKMQLIDLRFNPTADMKLTSKELHLAAYMYHPNTDMSETLLKIGKVEATRMDLDSLNPKRVVEPKLVDYMAAKITWLEQHNGSQTTWCLPLTFQLDVRNRLKVDNILDNYFEDWLHPYSGLTYIYVPIDEGVGHIFLIVIAIKECRVYHFDSYITEDRLWPRQIRMREACKMIHELTSHEKFANMPFHGKVEAHNWEVKEVEGIVEYGDSFMYNSPIWVMDWLSMGSSFMPNVKPKLDEKVLRMKLGINLVAGQHNECWTELDDKVERFWESIKPHAIKK